MALGVLRHSAPVTSILYDAEFVITGTLSGEITLWNPQTMRITKTFEDPGAILRIEQRQETDELVVQRRSLVERWSLTAGKKIATTETWSTSFSKIVQVGHNCFLSPLQDHDQLGLFEFESRIPKTVFKLPKVPGQELGGIVDICKFASLIAVAYEQGVVLWDLAKPCPVCTWFSPMVDSILQCVVPIADKLWTATLGGKITALCGEPLKSKTLARIPGGVATIAVRGDTKLVAIGGMDQDVHLRTRHGRELAVLAGHEGRINTITFRSSAFASGGEDCNVLLWDAYA